MRVSGGIIMAAAGVCLLAQAAEGKDRRRYRYDEQTYGARTGVIQRTLNDLDRAARSSRFDGDRYEDYQKAVENLVRFEDRWREGKFDKDRLDKAIDKIDDLAGSDRVDPRDRSLLSRDLAELRAFRSSGGRSAYYREGPNSRRYEYGDDDRYREDGAYRPRR